MSDQIPKSRKRQITTATLPNLPLSQYTCIDWFNIRDLWLMTSSVTMQTMKFILSRCCYKLVTLRVNCRPYELEHVVGTISCYKFQRLELLRFAVEKGTVPNNVKQLSDIFMMKILSSMKRLVYLYLFNWKYLTGVGFINSPPTLRFLYLERCKRISRTAMMCLNKNRDLRYMPTSILSFRYSYNLVSVLFKMFSFTSYSISHMSREVKFVVRVGIRAPDDVGLMILDEASRQYMTLILTKLVEDKDCYDWDLLMNVVLFYIHGYCILEPIQDQIVFVRDIFNPLITSARTLDCRNLYDMGKFSFRQIVAKCRNLRKVYISNCPQMTFQAVCKAVAVKNHPFPLVITLNDVSGPAGVNYKELENNVTVRFRKAANSQIQGEH